MDTFWLVTFFLLGFYVVGRVANHIQDQEFEQEERKREMTRQARINELYGKSTEESYDGPEA